MAFGELIPLKFQRLSGIDEYRFAITEASPSRYRYWWGPGGEPEPIPLSAFCVVRHQDSESLCLFPEDANAGAFEAIQLWAETWSASTRPAKFLTAFKANESLGAPASIHQRSIRHSLAHSTTQLRDPRVVAALDEMFGGPKIDFHNYYHQKAFYLHLGLLLKALDSALARTLVSMQLSWLPLRSERALIVGWQEEALGLDRAV